ncbi:unnamed protein product, partial [Mesorhabditis spiculigera]
MCDDRWSGDLCEYNLTDHCSMRGERLPDGGCACQPYFFGSICQYTSRCDQGHIRHGRCICQRIGAETIAI